MSRFAAVRRALALVTLALTIAALLMVQRGTAVAQPAAVAGRLILAPTQGPAGTVVTATAFGLPPRAAVAACWSAPEELPAEGAPAVPLACPTGDEVFRGEAETDGSLSFTFVSPDTDGGPRPVTVWGAGGPLAFSVFTATGRPETLVTDAPRMAIELSHRGHVRAGATATYLVSVSNLSDGLSPAPLSVSVTLPAGLTYVGAAGPGWACPPDAGATIVTCTHVDRLPARARASVLMTVRAGATPGIVVPRAVLTYAGDVRQGPAATDPTLIVAP